MEGQKEKLLRSQPLPEDLKRAFAGKCKVEGVRQQDVVRGLIEAFVAGRVDAKGRPAGKGKGRKG